MTTKSCEGLNLSLGLLFHTSSVGGRARVMRMQPLVSAAGLKVRPPHRDANSKINLGNVAMSQQKVDKASNLFSEAQSSDPSERDKAQLLCSRGVNEMQKGNVSRAIDLLNQSLKIRNKIKHSDGQTECYNYLGTAYMMQGRFDKGWDVCSKARDNADRDQDEGAKAHALFHMGQASVSMGDMSRGISELRLARGIFQNLRDREGTSNCDSMLRRLNTEPNFWILAGLGFIAVLFIFML